MTACRSQTIESALRLPAQVPWFGAEERAFIGSGLAGCCTSTRGVWSNLIGTSYSMETFLRKERLKAVIDGEPHTLNGAMHRAAETGILYSRQRFGDVIVYVVDFAPMHQPCITRLIAAHNVSNRAVRFNPYVEIKRPGPVGWHPESRGPAAAGRALTLVRPDGRLMTIKFAGLATAVRVFDEEHEVILDTPEQTIQPGDTRIIPLRHHAHAAVRPPREVALEIDGYDGVADLHACIAEWEQWFRCGRDLAFIQDDRARGIVEGTLAGIRMQQGECGGIMANPGGPTSSYVRDCHSALRGLLAAGHMAEARRYLHFVNDGFSKLVAGGRFGIPTSFPIGEDAPPFPGFGDADNWSCETPGLLVLTARRYYEATGDLDTLQRLDACLRYGVRVQLDFARAHDGLLLFNGDETESGGCGITMTDSITPERRSYSMASLVIAIASLAFFIEYLTLCGRAGETPAFRQALDRLRRSLDDNFWSEELGLYHWLRRFDGTFARTRMCNFQIMPLYFDGVTTRERAARCALSLKPFIADNGFIPNQPLGENRDFTGHNLGYLLYALTELDDPARDQVYHTLVNGPTVGCWGLWSEAYYDDGTPYGYGQTWDDRPHSLRPFESGTNIEAIIKYWDARR